jgi:hypothetical protein
MPPLDASVTKKIGLEIRGGRATWANENRIKAHKALADNDPGTTVTKKSDFNSEKQHANFVDKNGIVAYQALAN